MVSWKRFCNFGVNALEQFLDDLHDSDQELNEYFFGDFILWIEINAREALVSFFNEISKEISGEGSEMIAQVTEISKISVDKLRFISSNIIQPIQWFILSNTIVIYFC
ncbi:MAG: hypothetical protein ACFFCS_03750 [Candidatus Hodarchaeota archaeon]